MADGFEENAEFFTLTYETPLAVNHNVAFARIAPLLWLRAGSRGKRIDKLPAEGWAVVDAYGLLVDVDARHAFHQGCEQGQRLARGLHRYRRRSPLSGHRTALAAKAWSRCVCTNRI